MHPSEEAKMATSGDEFSTWLSKKLHSINPDADLDVFVQYISGIFESETDHEELLESLTGILAEIIVSVLAWPTPTHSTHNTTGGGGGTAISMAWISVHFPALPEVRARKPTSGTVCLRGTGGLENHCCWRLGRQARSG